MNADRRHIEIRTARDGQSYWLLIAGNGEVLATSETFTRPGDAYAAAEKAVPGVPISTD